MSDARVVLITGAGKGLGRAFAMDLARRGVRIVVNNRIRDAQPDSARDVVSAIESAGGVAIAETSDVTAPDAADAMVSAALGAYGRLDGVIFNAGITGDARRFEEMSPENFAAVMSTNFESVVRLTRAALPAIRQSDAGRLVYVSSSAGLYGVRGRSPYAASKGAVQAFALNMAIEEARHGCTSNLVLPYALTQMTKGAGGEQGDDMLAPEKVAPFVSWLCSEGCDLNGTSWMAGGGMVRQVRVLESCGALLPDDGNVQDWFADKRAQLETFDAGAGRIRHAEQAFADFVQELSSAR